MLRRLFFFFFFLLFFRGAAGLGLGHLHGHRRILGKSGTWLGQQHGRHDRRRGKDFSDCFHLRGPR
jgi:hypothetical protein